MSTTDSFNLSGNVVASSSEERKQLLTKGINNWTRFGVGCVLVGVMTSSGGILPQQISPTVRTLSMGTSYDAYNIRTDGFVRTKNSGMGAIRVKKTRRNVPVGMTASIEYHTKLPARPRIDTVENYDIRPIKHSNAFTEVSFSLEYGGRLPKRPRI